MSDLDRQKKNLEIIQTMAANGIKGNWDVVRPYVSDDLVMEMPHGLPYGKTFHGWDGYRAGLAALGFWTDLNFDLKDFALSDDKVVILADLSAKIGSNGKEIKQPYAAVWQLKDGKVIRITAFYYDTKEIADLAAE